MIKEIKVSFDHDRSVVLNPRTGSDMAKMPTMYPAELRFLAGLMKVMNKHRESCEKPIKET